jgi:hypothetical protein
MATNLASSTGTGRGRKLFGKIARYVKRYRNEGGPFARFKRSSSVLDWATRAYTAIGPAPNSRPRSPALWVKSLGIRSAQPGLVPIGGWAYSADKDCPEGIVEAALDNEDVWIELSNRFAGEGSTTGDDWKSRCMFQGALNTFLMSNGDHRLRLRVKTTAGQVAAAREVRFRVNHVGKLAETTARLVKSVPKAERIRADLIDSSDFPFDQARDVAWFERSDAESRVEEIVARRNLPADHEAHLKHFLKNGYMVLDGFIPREQCERINRDLDTLIGSGNLRYEFKGQRIEKMFEHSRATRDLWAHAEILKVLSAIFDDQAVPCQTLNFMHGSQQAVHQDVIHLTPFPAGFMCGVWVALEDIHPDSGPLLVYPGSHRLPRLYSQSVGAAKVRDPNKWDEFSAVYSPMVKEMIDRSGLEPIYYTPKAGSVLIWHENLAHGGSPRKNDELTRRSIVSHYFARGAIAFYDSQGVPAWTFPADDD